MTIFNSFREIWLVDFEFHQPSGNRPEPICMVAREIRSDNTIRLWADDLVALSNPPFSVVSESLFVAYYASAELGCFLALDWPVPTRILDLYAEFRSLANGLPTPCGNSLLGALTYFGLDGLTANEKSEMRELAIRGGPYLQSEQAALLDYCQSDVDALAKLLPAMSPKIDLPRALLRGRYMAAAARMEWVGTRIDRVMLARLREHWEPLKSRLVATVDAEYGIYVPSGRSEIKPDSAFGQAILAEAEANDIDPGELAESATNVWRQERETNRAFFDAKRAARRVTGLTVKRIAKWENNHKDYATWHGLDDSARILAGRYPELRIGPGYQSETGYDRTDYAARLWELLRDEQDRPKPRHDPDIIREAAEIIISSSSSVDYRALSFSATRFAEWLNRKRIPWPRLLSGALDLSDDTFRQMAKLYPEVAPIRELRHTLSQLRLNDLAVGSDGRNRCLLSAFRSKTGRNQPSNSKFIFGPSCWLRGLIKPETGRAVAYVDYEQQEFGIAAALSRDSAMMKAYESGDPYLSFAKQAGAVPPGATKRTHQLEREKFKVCALAVQYGMGRKSLAQSLGEPEVVGRDLLQLHRRTYPIFWRWSQAAVDHAMLHGWLHTVFGWRLQVGHDVNPRSLANFPMQANGAEMLRLACCLATERGLQVCAPIHDALLVEGSDNDIQSLVANTQAAMYEASEIVLDGFPLRTDAKIVRDPDRYMDERGERMWETVTKLLADLHVELVESVAPF